MRPACAPLRASVLLPLVPLVILGCSADREGPTESADSQLVRGKLVPPGELRSILELGDKADGAFCTAAKIDARHVLTAAHCIVVEPAERAARCERGAQEDIPTKCEKTAFWHGKDLRVRVRGPQASRWVTLGLRNVFIPNVVLDGCRTGNCFWDMAGHRGVPDVAIVELEEDIPTAESAPIDLRPVPAGIPLVVAGYGCTRSGPTHVSDDQLRADDSFTIALGAIPQREVADLEASHRPAIEKSYFFSPASGVFQSSLCPGDSGGPVLRPTGEILGVNAYYIPSATGSTMRANMFTRLDREARPSITDWIKRRAPGARFVEN